MLEMRSSHGHDMSIVGGIGRIGYMRGGSKAVWKDEDLAETFLSRALRFINNRQNTEQPFFCITLCISLMFPVYRQHASAA